MHNHWACGETFSKPSFEQMSHCNIIPLPSSQEDSDDVAVACDRWSGVHNRFHGELWHASFNLAPQANSEAVLIVARLMDARLYWQSSTKSRGKESIAYFAAFISRAVLGRIWFLVRVRLELPY
jgi:hypothetical protein